MAPNPTQSIYGSEDSPAIFNAFRSILGLIRIPSVIELLG